MILFTGGFPFAGKSEFVRILIGQPGMQNTVVIEPKAFYPQGFDNLSEESKTRVATAAWDVCIEQLNQFIIESPADQLIIFDTAAKRLHHMRPLFVQSKVRGHKVLYTFIGASIEDCKKRGGAKWRASFEDDYTTSFETTVPALKKISDAFFIAINKDDKHRQALNKIAKAVTALVEEIRN